MTRRSRHSILVQLADGDLGRQQREAIDAWSHDGEARSPTARLRTLLLSTAGRPDLDLEGPDVIERAKAGGRAKAGR